VTELGLLIVIYSGGLSFAVLLARWLGKSEGSGGELHRLGSALLRAADAFVAQELRLVALAAGVLAPIVFALYAVLSPAGRGVSGLESGFWAALGLMIGAASTALTARVAARLGLRASLRCLAAAQKSLDRALGVSVRTGGAVGLFVETVGVVGIVVVFGLLFAMKGGAKLDAVQVGELARSISTLLPAYALGVAAAALVLGRGGATYHAASDVAADLAGERDAGLEHDDARNPAVVADLVGDHVGATVSRAIDLFLAATLANVTAVIVGASVYEAVRTSGSASLSLAALPVVARAFGVVACAFGVMVVRTEDPESATVALWRGQAVTGIISLAGVAGSALWLVGEPHWLSFFWAGALGVAAATLGAHLGRYRIDRRVGPVRELIDTLRVGDAPAVAFGLGAGLQATAVPVLVIGAAMAGAWQLGSSSGVPWGGTLALLTALMTMLASAPYLLALATFGPVADGARGVSGMSAASISSEAQRRAARLDEAAFVATAVSRTYLVLTGCFAAALAASALGALAQGPAASLPSIDLAKPVVAWSGALGLCAVLAYAGSAARAGTRGARSVAQEVERQLRGFPRDKGRPVIPTDYTPSYRSCVELTAQGALHRLLLPVTAGLLGPAALAVVLSVVYRTRDAALPTEALAAFVIVASVAGLATTLAIDATRATLTAARRASRPSSASGGFGASVAGDAVADVMGDAAGPAAQLLVKTIAVVALAVAPFLHV
jgi:Na+/H+-translocating membrane pyrophosphatase